MKTTTANLIKVVDKERIKRRMSDRMFSIQILHISPSLYCRLKNGERALTLERLKDFQQKLPEITPAVTIYIMRQGNEQDKERETKGGITQEAP